MRDRAHDCDDEEFTYEWAVELAQYEVVPTVPAKMTAEERDFRVSSVMDGVDFDDLIDCRLSKEVNQHPGPILLILDFDF